MLFSKSYSDSAVQKSARWIRFFNDNLNFLLSIHEAKYHSKITKFFSVQHLGMFDRRKKEASIIMKTFGNGAMMSILNHFFDGKHKDFDKFAKDAINLAFNLGFGMNNGKSMFKGFIKDKMKISDFKSSGEDWADEFLIPKIIHKNLTIDEVEERYGDDAEDYDDEEDYDDVEEKKNSKNKKDTKSTISLKNNLQILENFIENYEFTVKDGEDYYEYEIFVNEDNSRLNCNIDVVLEDDDQKSYPFVQFIVDLSKKKISFNTSSVNSQTYKYKNVDDLIDIIEEEIHRS